MRESSPRPGSCQAESRPPLRERSDGDVEKPELEHRQERHRKELAVPNREPNEVGEINGESHLGDRQQATSSGMYLHFRQACFLRSIPYFGVRAKSDL